MSKRFEGQILSKDRTEIFFQKWVTAHPKGIVLITHGLAEHSDCYSTLAERLQNQGYEVYAIDLRGHGRSSGKRGYVQDFSDYIKDLKSLMDSILNESSSGQLPFYLFGHSMGGLVTTLLCLENPGLKANGIILSAPLFGLSLPVPAIKDAAAQFLVKWIPSITLHNELNYNHLSRDKEMVQSYAKDVLRHEKISPKVYIGMLNGFKTVHDRAREIKLPVLMQLAGQDKVVSTPIAQEVMGYLPNEKNVLEIYPESYHEIYNDFDKNQAFSDLIQFLTETSR